MLKDLSIFWGKTIPGGTCFHPAICHMIDVGIMAQELLQSFPSYLKNELSEPFSSNKDIALRRFGLMAALHDIGKISPGFQSKRPDLCAPQRDAGLRFTSPDTTRHGEVARCVLPDLLASRLVMDIDAAFAWTFTVAGHHGSIPAEANAPGRGKWQNVREEALDMLAHHFGVTSLEDARVLPTPSQVLLAGCVSVADWLASSKEHFPWDGGMPADLQTYEHERRLQARRVLGELRFHAKFASWPGFKELFGFEQPNSCQKALLDLGEKSDLPGLIILESPMGSGKTEAALAFLSTVASRRELRGFYFALPTQATSNAMLARLNRYLERAMEGGAELHLLHAHASLNDDYAGLRLASMGDDREAKVAANSWFAAAKRGLLAAGGVGTIDQALLATLKVRHFFVRLFGLSGKLLLLDEVHAYDAYMDEEIKCLLGWARLCGITVVLLSATLPQRKRHEFIRAFAPNARGETAPAYPRVTGVFEDGRIETKHIKGLDTAELHVVPHTIAGGKADTTVAILSQTLPADGCAACIMNTVAEAQELYRRLKSEPTLQNCPLFLFHARYPMERRLEIERQLLFLFGNKGDRPRRAVVVATQVIEQSLDLDFDVMISDLAPIDLLLQRSGRLHRHKRGERRHPRSLRLLLPDLTASTVDFGTSAFYHADILLLTAALFTNEKGQAEQKTIELPDSLGRWIEAVYGETPYPVPHHLQRHYEKLVLKREQSDTGARFAARVGTLENAFRANSNPDYLENLSCDHDDDQLLLSTRDGRVSVSLVILQQEQSLECAGKSDERRLFARVLNSDNTSLVDHFKDTRPPASWRESALLRHCRPLVFAQGHDTAGLGLHYDDELGLQIPPKKRGT